MMTSLQSINHHPPPYRPAYTPLDSQSATNALYSVIPPSERNAWIALAISAKRSGVSFDDFHNWSSSGDGYKNERQCRADWTAITEHGEITSATLYGAARDAGWQNSSAAARSAPDMRLLGAAFKETPPAPTANPKAQELWERCEPATDEHQYVIKKSGATDGLRVYPSTAPALSIQGHDVAGCLVAPCFSNGLLQTLQFIPPNGPKLNMPGGSFNDGYFTVGVIKPESTIYVVEGIGQAWACHQATASPAVCTFGAGRTKAVAKAIIEEYPEAKIILVPDRGQEKNSEAIASAVNCQWVHMPADSATNYDANDFAKDRGRQALRELLMHISSPPLRYKTLSGQELSNAAPLDWTVRGILPKTGLAGLYGPSGGGKSFLTLDLAAAIAGGARDWFGKRVTQRPVTYCVLEGEAGMGKRIKAWEQHHGKALPDRLRFVAQTVHLTSGEDVADLAKAIKHSGAEEGLVILDTLNRAAPGADENSSKDMGLILAAAKQLQKLLGGLVLLVHHTGKDKEKGMRGHSSLFAALDAAIGVNKSSSGLSWDVSKSKDDATGGVSGFNLEVVTLGSDEDGEPITSCVVVPVAAPFALRSSKAFSPNQQAALDALNALFMPVGAMMSKRLTLAAGVTTVAGVIESDAKHKRQRATEAIDALVKKSAICADENYIWAKPS